MPRAQLQDHGACTPINIMPGQENVELVRVRKMCAAFKQRSDRIYLLALLECMRVRLQCFIEVCVFTWTTAALLSGGSLLTSVNRVPMLGYLLALLMLQAAHFFFNVYVPAALPTTRLIHKHTCSAALAHGVFTRLALFSSLEFAFTVVFSCQAAGFFFFLLGLVHIPNDGHLHLNALIFTCLLGSNGLLGIAAFVLRCLALLKWYCPCDLKIYDMLLQVGLAKGINSLKQVDVVDAAFEFIGEEFKNNAKPAQIDAAYQDMIQFVCMHENGIYAALRALQSEDPFVRRGCLHMLECGLRMEQRLGIHQARLCFHRDLLRRLVDLSVQSVGSTELAAARCVHELAKQYSWVMLINTGEDNGERSLIRRVVDRVEEVLDTARMTQTLQCDVSNVDVSLSDWLLYSCRAVMAVLEYNKADFCRSFTQEQLCSLTSKLISAFEQSHCSWKHIQVVVARVLLLLSPSSLSEEKVYMHLKAKQAAPPCKIEMDEQEMKWFKDVSDYCATRPLEWETNAFIISIPTQDHTLYLQSSAKS